MAGYLPLTRRGILSLLFLLSTWCYYLGETQSVTPLVESNSSQMKLTTAALGANNNRTLSRTTTEFSSINTAEESPTMPEADTVVSGVSHNSTGPSTVSISMTEQATKDSTQAAITPRSEPKETTVPNGKPTSSTISMDTTTKTLNVITTSSQSDPFRTQSITKSLEGGLTPTMATASRPTTSRAAFTSQKTMDINISTSNLATATRPVEDATTNSRKVSDQSSRLRSTLLSTVEETTRLLEGNLSTTRIPPTMGRTTVAIKSTKSTTEAAERTTTSPMQVTTNPVATTTSVDSDTPSVSSTTHRTSTKHVSTQPDTTTKSTIKAPITIKGPGSSDGTTQDVPTSPTGSRLTSLPTTTKTATSEVTTTSFPCPTECTCNATAKIVDCRSSTLSSIPAEISSNTEILRLTDTGLSDLSDSSFFHLPELKTLEITGNSFSSISTAAFHGLNKLQVLELSNNQISTISGNWRGLESLTTLDLSVNILGNNSMEFDGLANLTTLNLAYNQLETVFTSLLAPLVSLESLDLNFNSMLSQIEVDAFMHNSRMKTLLISYTNLGQIQSTTFKHLDSLQKLDLSGNPLTSLPARVFEELHELLELSLASCSIAAVDYAAFAGLDRLHLMTLNGNSLESLSKVVFEPVSLLKFLLLGDNPWYCDCAARQLWDWLDDAEVTIFDVAQMLCSGPEHVTNQLVSSVKPAAFACEPYFLNAPAEVVVKDEGDFVELDCVVIGEPPLSTYWETPWGNFTSPSYGSRFQIFDGANDLFIVGLKPEDAGSYSCVSFNDYGVTRAEFQLAVIPLPRTTIARDTTTTATTLLQTMSRRPAITVEESSDCPTPLLSAVIATDVQTTSFKLQWGPCNGCDFLSLKSYVIVGSVFGETEKHVYGETVPTANNLVITELSPSTGYTACVLLEISQCPMVILYDNCVQVTTSRDSGDEDQQDKIDELNQKHLYEVVGTFVATLLVTLLIMASVFVLYWRCHQPKRVTKYSFLDPKSSSPNGGGAYDEYTTPITLNEVVNMEMDSPGSASPILGSPSTSGYHNKAMNHQEYVHGLKRNSKFFEKIDMEDLSDEISLADKTDATKKAEDKGKSKGKGPKSKIKKRKPAAVGDQLPSPIMEREALTAALQTESDTNSSEVSSSQSKGKDSPPPEYRSAIEMDDRSQGRKNPETIGDEGESRKEEKDPESQESGGENSGVEEANQNENDVHVTPDISILDPESTGAKPKVGVTTKKDDSDVSVTYL